ncbi:MAG: UDP-N-acetylmuramoyl-L-alanyl-D-glutamate--2,6-diaminopimelate ligase [Saprospiraceae bacterium]
MKLNQLLQNLNPVEILGNLEKRIENITFDSRAASNGSLFVAVKGTQVDGHNFIFKALASGCTAVVCERWDEPVNEQMTMIIVKDTAEALGILSSNFFGNPTNELKLVGVTGTNGKTTTTTLCYDLFTRLGYKVGLISTVENRIADKIVPSTHTTPDPLQMNALLKKMRDEGCEYVFMEVSSHAIDQRRIAGLRFTGAFFTNLTHDHLDYHKTFDAYLKAKKRLFDDLPKDAFALTNADDRNGAVMLQNTKAKTYSYGLKKMATFKAKILDNGITGLHLELDRQDFICRLIGEFNAYNLLAVYGVATLLGADKSDFLPILSDLTGAEGRFDCIQADGITAIVDYAHSPDALEKVLSTLDDIRKGKGNIITVVGCGGDRDRDKRPLMAKMACDYSNHVVLTADNPRNEDPEEIIKEMQVGVPVGSKRKVLVITDREQAIRTAFRLAAKDDFVLVAGKGHEKYQEFEKKHRIYFDDKAILLNEMKNISLPTEFGKTLQ